jgi:tetratricopeptide (TPR) repeat protein
MPRRTTPAIVTLTAVISVLLVGWSLDPSQAQQPKQGAQKGPVGGPKAGATAPPPTGNAMGGNAQSGNAQAGNTQGGDGDGRSPAQPHIARARQMINQAQDFDGAMKELDVALQLDPKNPFVHMWRGIDLNRMNRFLDAVGEFNQALAINPRLWGALNGRGYAYFSSGDSGKSLIDYNAAIDSDPKLPVAFIGRGIVFSSMGEQQRAVDDLTNATRLGPDQWQAYSNLGFVYNKMRQFDKAVPAFDEAQRLAPKNPGIYNGRGWANMNLGNTDAAIADLKQAITLAPNFMKAHGNLGRLYLDRRDADAAIAELNQVIQIEPQDAPALIARARAYEMAGNLDKALADVQAALAIAPQNSVGLAVQDRLKSKIAIASGMAPPPKADHAGVRVALVIGNSKYRGVDPLGNPARDAKLIADALSRSGFANVRTLIDGSRDDMSAALKKFSADAANADWAVIYYAGHGIEYDGNNFLVPVDVKYVEDADIPKESIPLDAALNAVSPASKLRLVMLDACRENPFASELHGSAENSSVGKGLARIEPESGTLVAFATKHGHVATDGDGQDSPFASAVAKRMQMPGVEINRLFRLVHDDVFATTNKEQEPFTYGQLSAQDFFFRAQ